ncbi:MAG TPA: hypothetical protein VFE90_04770 [Myxococcales bacterium]|nr:hypothetical protein [Myxococcales bacterium]
MRRALVLAALLSPAAFAQVRVEPRLLVKDHRWFVSGGLTWLERGDYYNSPGFLAQASYYLRENDAVEVRAIVFASWLGSSADEVFQNTGLVPDAQKPVSLLAAGWRHSLAYGKVTTGSSVLHFDLQGGADLGLLITDRAANPALLGFFGVAARLGNHLYGQFDLALMGSIESRSTTVFTMGFLPVLTLGAAL